MLHNCTLNTLPILIFSYLSENLNKDTSETGKIKTFNSFDSVPQDYRQV